jgi:hypothetical protein
MLQLNPPIPVNTPKGKGWAHVLIDYSQEHDLLWVVFLDETGECWTLPNRDIRIQSNLSLGRREREKNLEQSHARAVEPSHTSVPESNRPPQHTVLPDGGRVAPVPVPCPPPVCSWTQNVDTSY